MRVNMGSVCCVAVRDRTITDRSIADRSIADRSIASRSIADRSISNRTITNRPAGENLQRNIRHSPSWSFRWENRGRVAEEETSINWLSEGVGGNDRLDVKSGTTVETTYASEEGSPLDSFRSMRWQKSPVSEGNSGALGLPSSDSSVARNINEVRESTASPTISHPSPSKLTSAPSFSSLSMSPLSSKSHPVPANLTPSRLARHSPGPRLFRQVSDSRIPGFRSSPTLSISEEASSLMLPGWSNESLRGSNGGSSDSWSIPMLSELTNTRRERWSFDSESSGFSRDRINRSSGGLSLGSPSFHLRTCGICAKLLSEKSSFGSQKFIATNELAVVAVLPCGHVHHAECLESMTSEINKYDPACPICTFGEKQALKMSEKVLRAEIDLKAARKRSRNRVVDSDIDSDVIAFDHLNSSGHEERGGLKMSSSASMKSSSGKPFLKRHFSFGSKGNRSLSENHSTRKRVFFWTKSSKH